MVKSDKEKIMLTEHVLEVRHDASGTFLDLRGFIADYVRNQNFLPHWTIDANVINFRDAPDKINTEGAFVGYKSAGYVVLNPQTRNFFTDRASAFRKILLKNNRYQIPHPTRFGARTKLFVPSGKSFEEINRSMFEGVFTDQLRTLIGGKEKDLQFTIEFKEGVFEARIVGGPIHKEEADRYFQFESDHFNRAGLFLDIDYFKTQDFSLEEIPKLLRDTIEVMWTKAEQIATSLGL